MKNSMSIVTVVLLFAVPAFCGDEALLQGQQAYRLGDYAGAVDILEQAVATDATDPRIRVLLAASLLRLGERDLAAGQVAALEPFPKHAAALEKLIKTFEARTHQKKQVLEALRRRDTTAALALVNEVTSSEVQRAVLTAEIQRYGGSFDEALASLTNVKPTKYKERKKLVELVETIKAAQQEYASAWAAVDDILYGGLAPSTWEIMNKNRDNSLIERYLVAAQTLVTVAPASPRAMDLQFHVALISGDPNRLEMVGQQALAANGQIVLPAYGRSRYIDFVIDTKNKRLFSRVNSHTFRPKQTFKKGMTVKFLEREENGWTIGADVPFDLRFSDIQTVEQNAQGYSRNYASDGCGHCLRYDTFALRLNGHGTIPMWSLMNVLHHLYGSEAQVRATANLGAFLLNVINKPGITANLADPARAYAPGKGKAGMMLAALAVVGSAVDPSAATQQLSAQMMTMAQLDINKQNLLREDSSTRKAAWEEVVGSSIDVLDDSMFVEIETIMLAAG